MEIQFAEGTTGDAPHRVLVTPWTPPSRYRRREIIQEGEQPAASGEGGPGNAGWQRDLSVPQDKIGEVQQAQGALAAAL